jgi:sulfide:quinone oxidoreductase
VPSFLWVMIGARRPDQVSFDLRQLRRRGIDVLAADVLDIDPAHRRVKTSEAELACDRLVVSVGAELAPQLLPGFAEAAHNIYTLDGASAAGQDLRRFAGGRVVVLVSRLPYKCPAAPYEAAFLAEALLRRRGIGAGSSLDIYTPEPQPMPTAGPVLGEGWRRAPRGPRRTWAESPDFGRWCPIGTNGSTGGSSHALMLGC